jgi:hypothetical protein
VWCGFAASISRSRLTGDRSPEPRTPRAWAGSRAPRAGPGPHGAADALLALAAGEPVASATGSQVGMLDPLADHGLCQAELPGRPWLTVLPGRADHLDHLSLVLWREDSASASHLDSHPRAGPSSWCPQVRANSRGRCSRANRQRDVPSLRLAPVRGLLAKVGAVVRLPDKSGVGG